MTFADFKVAIGNLLPQDFTDQLTDSDLAVVFACYGVQGNMNACESYLRAIAIDRILGV